jgi:hypothetical protein
MQDSKYKQKREKYVALNYRINQECSAPPTFSFRAHQLGNRSHSATFKYSCTAEMAAQFIYVDGITI